MTKPDPEWVSSWQSLIKCGLHHGDGILPLLSDCPHHFAASALMRQFVESTQCDALLMIDDDMVFHKDAANHLRASAAQSDADIVSALYCSRHGKHHPLISRISTEKPGQFEFFSPEPGAHLIPVAFCGFGFTLISRRIIERMIRAHGHPLVIWPQEIVGEDVCFCRRAVALGATCAVDATLSVGHRAVVTVTWNTERAAAEYSTTISSAFVRLAEEA